MDSEHIDPATGEVRPGPFLRSAFNYDVMAVSDETALVCLDPTLTQQQFKDDADINIIVERFGITGRVPENPRIPAYGDFTGISDYRTALHAIRDADEAFMALPGMVRKEFDNDPQRYLEAFYDPSKEDRLRELGLLKPKPLPAQVSPVSPPQPGTPSPASAGPPASGKPAANSSTP